MCFLFLIKAFQALTQQTLLTSALVTLISESKGGKVEINGKTPSWQTVPIIGGAGQRAQTARGARGRAASSCYNAGIKRERCTTAERLYPFLHGPRSLATATVEKELWNCRAGMTARLRRGSWTRWCQSPQTQQQLSGGSELCVRVLQISTMSRQLEVKHKYLL